VGWGASSSRELRRQQLQQLTTRQAASQRLTTLLPLLQGFLYVRSSKTDNEYAHPLDLCPLVSEQQ
jgi:Cu2+-containing amine oxidase